MRLAVTIFVPEGVVIVSDGLAEIKNAKSDNGFLQKKQKSIFSFGESCFPLTLDLHCNALDNNS